MPQPQGTITTPISRDLVRRNRMTTRRSDGRETITHWKVLKQIDSPYGKFSLLEVKIETGRTHQIRAHLSSIGHPVAGDTLYGAPHEIKSSRKDATPLVLNRNFLHAAALRFMHPSKETPLSFEQPLPAELGRFLCQIGGK